MYKNKFSDLQLLRMALILWIAYFLVLALLDGLVAVTREEFTISQERNRMARELHDTLAHTLSGLSVQLQTAKPIGKSILPHRKRC